VDVAINQVWNATLIAELRENGGRAGGRFSGAPLLILHTRGARTGDPREHPLTYQRVDGDYAVFASNAGAPTHPAWLHNLLAHPVARIEVDGESVEVVARVADESDWAPIWERQKQTMPSLAQYEAQTDRRFPVVLLRPLFQTTV